MTAIRLLADEPPARGRVYRAWSSDARFPFVEIAEGGPYEIVHEDGTADGAEGVTLVEPFEVPAGEDERFLRAWRADHDRLTAQRGYLGVRLYRGDAPFRYIEIARWSSPLMVSRAGAQGTLYQLAEA